MWSVRHFTIWHCLYNYGASLWRQCSCPRAPQKHSVVTVAQLGERACLRVHNNSIILSQLRVKLSWERCVECLSSFLKLSWLGYMYLFVDFSLMRRNAEVFVTSALAWDWCGSDIQTESHLEPLKDRASNLWNSVIKASLEGDARQTNCRLTILGWGCPVCPLWRHLTHELNQLWIHQPFSSFAILM